MFILVNDKYDQFINRTGSPTPNLQDAQVFYDSTGASRWMTLKGLRLADWFIVPVEIKLKEDGS